MSEVNKHDLLMLIVLLTMILGTSEWMM